jgi:hypothetical protein
MIRTYSVTLDNLIVERTKKIYKKDGGKLSPLINKLLLEYCIKEEKKNGS